MTCAVARAPGLTLVTVALAAGCLIDPSGLRIAASPPDGDADGDTDTDASGDAEGDGDAGPDGDIDGDANEDADVVPSDWVDVAYRSRHRAMVTTPTLSEDIHDFPLLVVLEAGTFDYSRAEPLGDDLLFVDPAGGEQLPHEIESWDPEGASSIWVRAPLLTSEATVEVFHVYYDLGASGASPSTTEVWRSGFAAVFHLSDDELDSTSHAHHGVNDGSEVVGGRVAGGRHFTFAEADGIAIASHELPYGDTPRSICAWATADAVDDGMHWAVSYGAFVTNGGFFLGRVNRALWCGGVGDDAIAEEVFEVGVWTYVCCTMEAGAVTLHADGEVVAGPVAKPWTLEPGEAFLGAHINPGAERWSGNIDEVRISSTARTTDWIRLEHQSMSPGFVTLSPAEHLDDHF